MLDIDGSHGTGGGQLVRNAVALAALTGTAMRIRAIRAKRGKPGLAPQHLTAVRAVGEICGARIDGLAPRSKEIAFDPGPVRGGGFAFDVGTAGSVTLVLQALLPLMVAARAGFHVEVAGGTDVRAAPPLDYLREVLLPLIARMGADVRLATRRRGYFPRGGGVVEVTVAPRALRPLRLDAPGRLLGVDGLAHVAHLPAHIAERMRSSALGRLGTRAVPPVCDTAILQGEEAIGQGGALVMWARCEHTVLGAGRVAERGLRSEALGEAVGAELAADLDANATLDVHAADQILVYAALAGGESSFTTRELTEHARTAMWLIEQLLPVRFAISREAALTRICVSPRSTMIPIQDLLHRIQWDSEFTKGEFVLGYYDRVEDRIVRVPFRRVHFEKGEHFMFEAVEDDGAVHSVPLHRVREVWRNGELIWHREAAA